MNDMRAPLLSLLLVLALIGTADAQGDSDNFLELKDKVFGTIEIPGDSLEASFYAPRETSIKLKAKKDGKIDPGVTLTLFASRPTKPRSRSTARARPTSPSPGSTAWS
jgi:hypothetical protein